ncbi:MAG: EVE domain-containing protein [Lawsonibacter sp.]|nr:EVE domain-containing protein [Lawsonibacter sp.]
MAYYISLFSPETYFAFTASEKNTAGVREHLQNAASRVRPGDKLVCYLTKLSRWVGILEVKSPCFLDNTPIFLPSADPFKVRFQVSPQVWLAPEYGIPVQENVCWERLSFTRELPRNSTVWTTMFRRSLRELPEEDGCCLEQLLTGQEAEKVRYEFSAADRKNLRPSLVNAETRQIPVLIPEDEPESNPHSEPESDSGTCGGPEAGHTRIQALLAEIGAEMRFKIWLPRNDRQRVLAVWNPPSEGVLLDRLPMNLDQLTMRMIENIDVLWIRRRAIVHAFEVEHSTSIYSGLLRMADLMAVHPNLAIKAHIVAPLSRRTKVLREISRPVFSLIESGPMSETCSYLSYDAVAELRSERNLQHLNDSVLEEYTEYAAETEF